MTMMTMRATATATPTRVRATTATTAAAHKGANPLGGLSRAGSRDGAPRRRTIARADVDPQDLAILQQKLGQRITFEGAGAAELNRKTLVDASGRAMSKDDNKVSTKNPDALEIAYDPDGLFPDVDETSSSMLIDRRLSIKAAEAEKEMEEELKKKHKEEREKLQAERDARVQPQNDPEGLVQYFFETEINEMEYEIVRCRPLLTDEFFNALKASIETADGLDKERREALFTVTSGFVGFVDQTTKAMLQPRERMMKLLTAKDKKAMILEMVETGELDINLMALLKTNENTAREAGLLKEAEFMQKIYNACAKFVSV